MKFKIFFISLLLIFTSCQNIEQSPTPFFSEFSLMESADPESDNEYLERMERYDEILASSPIPVYIISETEFMEDIFMKADNNYPLEKISDVNILGSYFFGQTIKAWPDEFIFINKRLTPEQIMVTYFHEIGHYFHRKSGCQWCIDNPIIRESHAFYNELKMSWEYELPYVLESSVRTMALYAIDKKSNMTYKMAVFEVMKTDLWKQTMTFLKEQEEGK